jgi:protein-L-isoaspartate(D-aspartate) O-methyltransferase
MSTQGNGEGPRVLLSLEEARDLLLRSLAADIKDTRVLEALRKVPRERFVDADLRAHAYSDRPLPIGHGQTISQPRMVALMLQELALTGSERVLDLGSGSGYQTALLAELAKEVVAVELVPELVERSRRVLLDLGYKNFIVHQATDELGWPASAPYDAIVVAAASPRVPMSLIDQLAEGGRMVIPVGGRSRQELMRVEQTREGVRVSRRGGCGFVPLIGRDAFGRSDILGHDSRT